MIFHCNCRFLSKEDRVSKKGNKYCVVTIMEGVETLTVMSDVDITADFGKEFTAVFDYDTKFKNLRLIGAN